MNIHYSVRHIKLTDAIRDYVEEKLGDMDRLDEHAFGAHVVLYHDETHGAKQFQVKVHIGLPGNDVHAEVHSHDLYEGIDLVCGKVGAQLRKHKTRMKSKRVKATQKVLRVLRGK